MERPSSFREVDAVTNADAIRQLSCAEALRQRGRPLRLFTPALLVTHGGFDRDPVQEFDARYSLPADKRPFCVQLRSDNERFFEGLGTKSIDPRYLTPWDQRLYAIDEQYVEDCFGFLGGIAWSDPKTGTFASTMSYDLDIQDPTSRAGEWLTVKVFGVLANKFVAYLHERPGQRPIARRVPFDGKLLPPALYRPSLVGFAPTDDPLSMRDD